MNLVNVGYDSTNYYVLEGGQGARLLVDVGFPGTLPKLQAALKRKSLALADLTAVVATHYHPDHAGLIQELKPLGLQHLVLEPQLAAIPALQQHLKPDSGYVPITTSDATILPLSQTRAWLARLGLVGEIIATPGHSADSVSLVLDDGQAFTGDLTLPMLAQEDNAAVIQASWAQLHRLGVCILHPGHGPVRPMPQ
jgi:endoribonuclease LACTB2